MDIRPITKEALKPIYHNHMVNDFPADELKPWSAIHALYDRGIYESYGLYDGSELLAYACLTRQQDEAWYLLDYYAVCAQYRSHGYGSQFITMLWQACQHLQGIFVEIEQIDQANDQDERAIRERRRNFYLRNGLKTTSIRTQLFGVHYEMLYMPCATLQPEDQTLLGELTKIYQTIVPAQLYQQNVQLTLQNTPQVTEK